MDIKKLHKIEFDRSFLDQVSTDFAEFDRQADEALTEFFRRKQHLLEAVARLAIEHEHSEFTPACAARFEIIAHSPILTDGPAEHVRLDCKTIMEVRWNGRLRVIPRLRRLLTPEDQASCEFLDETAAEHIDRFIDGANAEHKALVEKCSHVQWELMTSGSCATLEEVPEEATVLFIGDEEVIGRCVECQRWLVDGDVYEYDDDPMHYLCKKCSPEDE